MSANRLYIPTEFVDLSFPSITIACLLSHEPRYRIFNEDDLEMLRLIMRAKMLGFSLEQARELTTFLRNESHNAKDVKVIATQHVAKLDKRIVDMTEMRDA